MLAMDLELTEEQRIFKEAIRSFVEREVLPLVEEAEQTERFPVRLFRRMGGARIPVREVSS